jgi:hypothetical protein
VNDTIHNDSPVPLTPAKKGHKILELVPKPAWFWTRSWKNRLNARFFTEFKTAVPKTEVLEQPQFTKWQRGIWLNRNSCLAAMTDGSLGRRYGSC